MKEKILKEHEKDHEGQMHKHEETITVIVNGVKHEIREKCLTFEEIITLAFGQYDTADNIAYTVTFSSKKGHQNEKGILVAGDSVKIKEGMVFNASKTTRS
ncbi:MAG: multiubiquitin domain-containing protein [Lachnospiraceae bacterium]